MRAEYEDIDFASWLAGSAESAAVAVPLVLDAVAPASVVDVGCGLGAWLAVFREHGVEEIRGYDGPWVDRSLLEIAPPEFRTHDLREPLAAERRFELALCLEVAHLLEPMDGDRLVASLVALADVVVFSAGIPHQGGYNHLNEQWPRYWAERFARHEYVATDPFRSTLWEQDDVKWWFAQNIVCFVADGALSRLPALERARCAGGAPLPLVHPDCFLTHVQREPERPQGRFWHRRGATT